MDFVICCASEYGSKDSTWMVSDAPQPHSGDRAFYSKIKAKCSPLNIPLQADNSITHLHTLSRCLCVNWLCYCVLFSAISLQC